MEMNLFHKLRTTIVMAIAFTAEHADTMVVSALYLPIGRSLDVSVTKLGELSMWRGLVTAIIVPFVGVAGNLTNRIYLITCGAIIWAGMSTAFGLSTSYSQAAAWCALNGVGLALVMPCVQSIIAEVYHARQRGRAFGTIFTVSALGGMLFNFLAITFGNQEIHHYEGWRVMVFVVAVFAAVSAAAVFLGGVEPRRIQEGQGQPKDAVSFGHALWQGLITIYTSTRMVFRIRSFQIIMFASIVGTVGSMAFGYKVLYLQLLGFSDVATATLSLCTTLGIALGFLMGGWAADALALRMPYAARPFINQLSMATAGPLTVVLFKAMPGSSAHASGVPGSLDHLLPQYGFLVFAIGALSSWPASNNAAIFAEIVPEAVRTSVYAFDKCITGALGALSTPLAGVLAERVFGFTKLSHKHASGSAPPLDHAGGNAAAARAAAEAASNRNNAHALENGLLCIMLIPMALKFLVYSALYYTLKRDRLAAGEDRELLLTELTKKDSEAGCEAGPDAPEAAAAASRKLPAAGEEIRADARAQTLPGRPQSAELRRLRSLNRQSVPGQMSGGRAQSLGATARPFRDGIERFFDLEMSLPGVPSPRAVPGSQPHK